MTFINDDLSVACNDVRHFASANQALDHRDIDPLRGLPLSGADHADNSIVDRQKCLQTFGPLLQELATMDQYECAHLSPGDQRRCDNGFSERGRRRQNAEIMAGDGIDRFDLLWPKHACELSIYTRPGITLVVEISFDVVHSEKIDDFIQATPWQCDVMSV